MSTTNQRALNSLALMETSLLSKDYLSTFVPFVATLTLKKKYTTIDLAKIVSDFPEEYGIQIPRAPMQSILARAVNSGCIELSSNGQYLPNKEKMLSVSFAGKQQDAVADIRSLLNNFIRYVNDAHEINITKSEAEDIFVGFLDEYSTTTVLKPFSEIDWTSNQSKRNLYLMGEFLQSLYNNDFRLFETARKYAMASMVASALAFDDSTEEMRLKEFGNLTIYLDTPIILRIMGWQTDELMDSYQALFASFAETIKPSFKIFQHTLDEINNILSACSYWIENEKYDSFYASEALLQFVRKKYSKTQIELLKSKLLDNLKSEFQIEVDAEDYYKLGNDSAQIDETILRTRIIETYSERGGMIKDHSIDYDIKSVAYIMRLWGHKTSWDYSSLGSVFLTSNAALAYASRKYTSEYSGDGKNYKSPCITDYYLGTMIWLSIPCNKLESYSKLKLLADCSAATSISRPVMDKFVEALHRLGETKEISDGDFLLLRTKAFEKGYLQNITLNEEDAFKDGTMEQLLEDIKADIRKPLVDEINHHKEQIFSLQKENEQFVKAQQCEEAHILSLEKKGKKMAQKIINFTPIIAGVFAFIFVILQILLAFSPILNVLRVIAAFIALIFVVIRVLLQSQKLKAWLEARAIRHLKIKDFKKHS